MQPWTTCCSWPSFEQGIALNVCLRSFHSSKRFVLIYCRVPKWTIEVILWEDFRNGFTISTSISMVYFSDIHRYCAQLEFPRFLINCHKRSGGHLSTEYKTIEGRELHHQVLLSRENFLFAHFTISVTSQLTFVKDAAYGSAFSKSVCLNCTPFPMPFRSMVFQTSKL